MARKASVVIEKDEREMGIMAEANPQPIKMFAKQISPRDKERDFPRAIRKP